MDGSNQAERGSTPHRQKRRPGQQPPPRRSRAERDSSSSRKPRSHRHQSPSSSTAASSSHLRRKVSFDPGQQAPSRNVGLSRHQSFDPRLGRSARHQQDAANDPEAAWAKLVARTQNLEEALAGERASRRLLAARSAQERVDLLAQLAKVTEDKEGMEHLWRDSKAQLEQRSKEWDLERAALYEELARLRVAIKHAGFEPGPPALPPANITVALRESVESGEAGDLPTGTPAGTPALRASSLKGESENVTPPESMRPPPVETPMSSPDVFVAKTRVRRPPTGKPPQQQGRALTAPPITTQPQQQPLSLDDGGSASSAETSSPPQQQPPPSTQPPQKQQPGFQGRR